MKNKNLPALDDIELRKLNTKIVIGSIDKIGEFVKTYQKEKRISIISGLISLGLVLILVVGGLIYIHLKTDGNFFDTIFDTDTTSARFVCSESNGNLTFRFAKNAIEFKELFPNGNCSYYSVKK